MILFFWEILMSVRTFRNMPFFILFFILLLFLVMETCTFIVNQTKQALVLQFGECKTVHQEPGLKFKLPFIQDILFFEKRVLNADLQPIQVTTHDQKRLVVNTYTRYRIADPLKFYKNMQPATEDRARAGLEIIVSSAVRNILGRADLRDILNPKRAVILKRINEEVKKVVEPLGLSIIDIRIIRTGLPPENKKAVFGRMNADLARYATQNRANGEKAAQIARAEADYQRTVILTNAIKKAQSLKGEGDAKAITIGANSYGRNIEFYSFYRNLESYKTSLRNEHGTTQFMMSSSMDYLHLLRGIHQQRGAK